MEKTELIRRAMERSLGNNYEALRAYFQKIINGRYDFMVFISRRCYILFQMFAFIEGWNFDNVSTDLGIFVHREMLRRSKRVIVADDIGYTGRSMQNVLKRIMTYVPGNCKVEAVLFAVNRKSADQIFNRKIGLLSKINVKSCLQLTNHQCQDLSVRLVAAILDAGMPYTTFVYPIWGKIKKDIGESFKVSDYKRGKGLFDQKWETRYLDLEQNKLDLEQNGLNLEWTHRLGNYACVRIYKDPQNGERGFCLPFVFLKDIKKDRVSAWFEYVADTFNEVGCAEAEKEFRKALSVKKVWLKDAEEYLASVISCICSKSIAEILQLNQYMDVQEGIECSLSGSFSPDILQLLKKWDADMAVRFFEKLCADMDAQEPFFHEGQSDAGIVTKELKAYVSEHCGNMDVYEASYSIFEWLKKEDGGEVLEGRSMKSLCVEDIVFVLKQAGYAEKDIYLAQIECWDIGVATYRLRYDDDRGITAKCSAGEMSTVIPMLKYQGLVREYYDTKLAMEFEGNTRTPKAVLEDVLQKALAEQRYSEKEIDAFRELFEERKGSLYGLMI